MLSGGTIPSSKQREEIKEDLHQQDTLNDVRKFYESTTVTLIRNTKRRLGNTYQIDVVKE